MPMLEDQPADIILYISQFLNRNSLLTFRLVCRSLCSVVTPYAFRNVTIDFRGKRNIVSKNIAERLYGFKNNPELVQTLARNAHRLTIHTNVYYFAEGPGASEDAVPEDSIDPICEGLLQFKSVKSLDLRWEYGYNSSPEIAVVIRDMRDKLCLAVLEATGYSLEELALVPLSSEPYVPTPLTASPLGLRSFRIEHSEWGGTCRGPRIPGPEESSAQGDSATGDHSQETDSNRCPHASCNPLPLDVIKKIVQLNPLERLDVLHGCMVKGFQPEYIFPPRDEPSPLRFLTIKGLSFKSYMSGPTSAPHLLPANSLCNLTHLTIKSPAHLFNLDILWRSFEAARTELQTLVTRQVSYSLCAYLASYSGLRELIIEEVGKDDDSTNERTLSTFFDDALPRHAKTLGELKVRSPTLSAPIVRRDAGWAFSTSANHDDKWGRALSRLTALRSLHVEPCFTLKLGARSPYVRPTAAPLVQEYQIALDHIADLAPQINSVKFLWPEINGITCGIGGVGWAGKREEVIKEVVATLRFSSKSPKELILDHHVFRSTFDQDKEVFSYVKVLRR